MPFANYKTANNASSVLASSISAGASSLVCTTGHGGRFPSVFPFLLTIEKVVSGAVTKREIVKVTNRSGDAFTIVRSAGYCLVSDTATAQTNTAQSFDAGDTISERVTGEMFDDMNTEIARLETEKLDVSDYQNGEKVYAATSTGTDAYAITLTPPITSYITAQTFKFLSDVANTGPATLNVNGLGAKTIKKLRDQDLDSGDIEAGQFVMVTYDGTNFQMNSQIATIPTVDIHGQAEDTFLDDEDEFMIYDSESLSTRKIKGKYLGLRGKKYTADGDIEPMDSVYVTGGNTVKTVGPTSMSLATSVPTAQNITQWGSKNMPLSGGKYLAVTGGALDNSRNLEATVRTMGVLETDFSNGTFASIYSVSNGVKWFDICQIDTDKFLCIYQADSSGAGAGIFTRVISVSGITITVGAATTIETTGLISSGQNGACCKLETNKAAIFYRKDSDTFLYTQALTVVGTTITTNTPYLVNGVAARLMVACPIGDNNVCLAYAGGTNTVLHGRVVSFAGIVATVGSENTLRSDASGGEWSLGIATVTSTKTLLIYGKSGGTRSKLAHMTVSGSTLTVSSTVDLSNNAVTVYYGISVVGKSYALVLDLTSNTVGTLYFVDISGGSPVHISNQTLTNTVSTGSYGFSVVKFAPWTYVTHNGGATANDGDYIVKLVPPTALIGISEGSIAGGSVGAIALRYNLAVLSGLTAGATYYIDDDGKPTTTYSRTAPLLGVGISSTSIILQ